MSKLVLVTGGTKSGKSFFSERYAASEAEALGQPEKVLYIATAKILDDEMKSRVDIHQSRRNKNWMTYEGYSDLDIIVGKTDIKTVLFDCVGNMITNLMLDKYSDFDSVSKEDINILEKEIKSEFIKFLDKVRERGMTAVLVTNEVGDSLISMYRMGRVFTDIIGSTNQLIALASDEVYQLVCGIPNRLK